MRIFKKIEDFLSALDTAEITPERQEILQVFIEHIVFQIASEEAVRLNFICTHNSRRSHFAQIWAQTIAAWLELPKIECYSGGTEATAVYQSVISSLQHSGFEIAELSKGENPVLSVRYGENQLPIIAFSKEFDHPFNPKNFAAIMTCADADENCPFIPSASIRLKMTFEDPKISDGSSEEARHYQERSNQIATEMLYVFQQVKARLYEN